MIDRLPVFMLLAAEQEAAVKPSSLLTCYRRWNLMPRIDPDGGVVAPGAATVATPAAQPARQRLNP